MPTFLYKTRGNSSPERKPRVYFTCHSKDFSLFFEKICQDVFKTHDCAIFYTENMTEEIEEKYKESDLGQMNLFIIPITFKLLSQPNRAMDSDLRDCSEKSQITAEACQSARGASQRLDPVSFKALVPNGSETVIKRRFFEARRTSRVFNVRAFRLLLAKITVKNKSACIALSPKGITQCKRFFCKK